MCLPGMTLDGNFRGQDSLPSSPTCPPQTRGALASAPYPFSIVIGEPDPAGQISHAPPQARSLGLTLPEGQ